MNPIDCLYEDLSRLTGEAEDDYEFRLAAIRIDLIKEQQRLLGSKFEFEENRIKLLKLADERIRQITAYLTNQEPSIRPNLPPKSNKSPRAELPWKTHVQKYFSDYLSRNNRLPSFTDTWAHIKGRANSGVDEIFISVDDDCNFEEILEISGSGLKIQTITKKTVKNYVSKLRTSYK